MGIAHTLAMIRRLQALLADESAVTAIEYAMIAGIASIAIVASVTNLGSTLSGFFVSLSAAL
jgi:Flp pilus assembly pilin Flp